MQLQTNEKAGGRVGSDVGQLWKGYAKRTKVVESEYLRVSLTSW